MSNNNPEGERPEDILKRTFEKLGGKEREYNDTEAETVNKVREIKNRLFDKVNQIDEEKKEGYLNTVTEMPFTFTENLLEINPSYGEKEEENEGMEKYKSYALWHVLSGSSPFESAVNFDFEDYPIIKFLEGIASEYEIDISDILESEEE